MEFTENSVSMFLRNLQQGDLVCCCLFNDKVQMLNRMQTSQPKPAITYTQPKPSSNYSQPSSYSSNQNISPKKEKKKCVIY